MGTRNLTMVFKDGEYKVAQYGQWDGHPDGQGLTALTFLRDKMNRELFFARLATTFEPNDAQIAEYNARIKAENSSVARLYPSLTRDTGAEILLMIQNSTDPLPLRLEKEFAGESVMCEWAWVADFDKGTFEGFKGFNETPLVEDDRFFGFPQERASSYYPVKLVASFPLDNLPSDKDFLAEFRDPDEDED